MEILEGKEEQMVDWGKKVRKMLEAGMEIPLHTVQGWNMRGPYKIKTGDVLNCKTWHGRLCSMKAQIENEQDFERSEEGFAAMIKWLEEKYSE